MSELSDFIRPEIMSTECLLLPRGTYLALIALAWAVHEHFDGTDAPLGKTAAEVLAMVK